MLASYDSNSREKQINTDSVRHVIVIIMTIYSTQLRYIPQSWGCCPPWAFLWWAPMEWASKSVAVVWGSRQNRHSVGAPSSWTLHPMRVSGVDGLWWDWGVYYALSLLFHGGGAPAATPCHFPGMLGVQLSSGRVAGAFLGGTWPPGSACAQACSVSVGHLLAPLPL